MFDFLFRRKSKSKNIAKDRLKLVLIQDRLAISPHVMEKLRDDVIMAISKYVEIDADNTEFMWKDIDRQKALVASIAVKSVKRGVITNDRASQRSY
jgi:cell division topological specificity factor